MSALANGSGNRIRPERSGRKLIQKFQFSSDTEGGEEGKGRILRGGRRRDAEVTRSRQMASLSIADMSPRLALQRILALFERGEQREAAAFLHRLSITTFRQILPDLPTDLFVESLPQSLPVLEALYAKLFLAGGKQLPAALSVSPETVIWQLVKFFACQVSLFFIARTWQCQVISVRSCFYDRKLDWHCWQRGEKMSNDQAYYWELGKYHTATLARLLPTV